ncbi:hypothetical protein [Chryseobacterium oranimense]|uniref:tetratricopeptide repeat protein n=1 Tax=Chryseobacterium oranimense TaxID=421058 RepID=UPI0031DC6B6D
MCNFFNHFVSEFKSYIRSGLIKSSSLVLFFVYINIHSQNTIKEIDSIQKTLHEKQINEGDFYKIISQEYIIISKSRLLKYKKGEIKGYINIAKALNVTNKNRESLKFLEKADLELKNFNDNELKAYMHYIYGTNFYSLGLHARAIKSFNKSLLFAQKIENKTAKEKRIYAIYDWKRSSFEFLGMMDSVYSNERKCMRSPMPMLYITIAQRHFKSHNIDSAEYYINKADSLLSVKKIPVEGKANVLRAFGQLYIEKKDYKTSIDYLLKSLAITQKAHLRKRTLDSYKLIAEAYRGLKNHEKENEFLVKYAQLDDSLREVERKVLNTSIEKVLIDDEEIKEKHNLTLKYTIVVLIIISAVLMLAIYIFYNKKEKKKDLIIVQKNMEAMLLKQKLVNAYEEVTHLAVKKDPSFINRFKQVYPEFYSNLTTTYPELTLNDIRLCAFIKLNFSNKEIAEYAHISVRTVESQKYRLRKKLGLSADVDFNKWVANQ